MIVSYGRKFSFTHLIKTGGSSITEALIPYVDGPPFEGEVHAWQVKYHNVGGMHTGYQYIEDITSFAFVRNPWDRWATYYGALRNRKEKLRDIHKLAQRLSFEDFLHHISCNPQLQYLQLRQLVCPATRKMVEYVGRYETLEDDWFTICKKLGIPHTVLNRRNESTYEKPVYTNRAIDIVEDMCWIDIEEFNYDYVENS